MILEYLMQQQLIRAVVAFSADVCSFRMWLHC